MELTALVIVVVIFSFYGALLGLYVPIGLLYLQFNQTERKRVFIISITSVITLMACYALFLSYFIAQL
jgi:hypothetical protein